MNTYQDRQNGSTGSVPAATEALTAAYRERIAQILQACRPPGDDPGDRDGDGDIIGGRGPDYHAALALDSAAELIGEMFSEDPAEQRAFFLATFTTPNERS